MNPSNPAIFVKKHGILGYLHYLVFPLDLFLTGDEYWAAGREQRVVELTPILCWLIPLIVFLSDTTSLNFFGLVFLFLFEIIVLTILSLIYCWRFSTGFVFELFVNYLLSFILLSFALFAIIFMFSACGIIGIIFILVILFMSMSSKYQTGYDDGDW